jgi:hypothetical protein
MNKEKIYNMTISGRIGIKCSVNVFIREYKNYMK